MELYITQEHRDNILVQNTRYKILKEKSSGVQDMMILDSIYSYRIIRIPRTVLGYFQVTPPFVSPWVLR